MHKVSSCLYDIAQKLAMSPIQRVEDRIREVKEFDFKKALMGMKKRSDVSPGDFKIRDDVAFRYWLGVSNVVDIEGFPVVFSKYFISDNAWINAYVKVPEDLEIEHKPRHASFHHGTVFGVDTGHDNNNEMDVKGLFNSAKEQIIEVIKDIKKIEKAQKMDAVV